MIGVNGIRKNLENLIGKEFNFDDVICAFEDYEEQGVSSIDFDCHSRPGHIFCTVDVVFPSLEFDILLNSNSVITHVHDNFS